ncbi:MAG: hypothetical protein M1834_006160 [Cirrosporium novae-zelandiae]|nr:MAG: hypothetical protein M1834_006160 [Cirrosporium novae-zelandiae]
MPRRKWIDKKSATNFQLLHRAQNDPKIHDASASSFVFAEVAAPNTNKSKHLHDLEEELGDNEVQHIRQNEGEAANYGIYYDDTEYDYMQHMREIGQSGDAYFVEATVKDGKGKGKQKMKLEDALKQMTLRDEQEEKEKEKEKIELDESLLPSKYLERLTYQNQQDTPDAISGFQPDMDPRLREVLEALNDEAYIDDGGEDDIFKELSKDGEEIDEDEFEALAPIEDEDDGWESDVTAKPDDEHPAAQSTSSTPADSSTASVQDGDWLVEFSKFKKASKKSPSPNAPSTILTGTSFMTAGGTRHKKRKGALTSASSYSMTSSSLFRTEGLRTLDDRFDKIEEEYNEDGEYDGFDDNESLASGMTGMSKMSSMSKISNMTGASTMSHAELQSSGQLRNDFDSIMDDFLGGYSKSGKKRVKKGGHQTGMQQLDEIRHGLGPAMVPAGARVPALVSKQ